MSVHLETPSRRHEAAFLRAVEASRRLHRKWVTPPATVEQYRGYLARLRKPSQLGHFVCLAEGELAGVINVNEIVGGVFRSGYLGYYALAPHAGQGHMTRGLELVLARAFRAEELHRLEANIQPGNEPSRALVRRLGFRLEGYSPKYLWIAGKWRDHERWAITLEDWRAGRARRHTAGKSAPGKAGRARSSV